MDDFLAISTNIANILKTFEGDTVKYKNGKIASPDMYLGSSIQNKYISYIYCWTITSIDYIHAKIDTVEGVIKSKLFKLVLKSNTHMTSS